MPRDKLIQVRAGTASEWTAANPVLAKAEMGYETNTTKIKVGDGVTAWSSLSYISSWGSGGGGGGGSQWGQITGTLSNQEDLQSALDLKQDASSAFSGAYADLTGKPTIPTLTSQLTNDSGFITSAPVASVAGKTGTVTLVKGDVGLGNVDNTSDLSKPISTATQSALDDKQPLATVLTNTTASFTTAQETKLAGIASGATANQTDAYLLSRANHTGTQAISTVTGLQTALDGKQATLVSGTNIKTVNGTSLLGSGDVVIGGSASWGSITGTLSSQTDLQSALDDKAAFSIETEVIAARGDRSSLNLRISTISNFASPNAGGVISGKYYDQSFHGSNAGTVAGVANRLEMSPFYTSQPLSVDRIGVACSTAVAGAQGKCFIYGSDSEGWPSTLLYEGSVLDLSTTGYKSETLSPAFTFDSGRQYWLGYRSSSTARIMTCPVSNMPNLGLVSATGSQQSTQIRKTLTFATALPDPWVFSASELAAGNPPSIRMRAV